MWFWNYGKQNLNCTVVASHGTTLATRIKLVNGHPSIHPLSLTAYTLTVMYSGGGEVVPPG